MYFDKESVLFLDGKFLKAKDAQTDLYGQTLQYGYGVFEGLRSYQTQNGVKIFKAREHFERMKLSCARMGIPFDYETDDLIQIAYQVLRRNNLTNAYLRPLVFCGPNMMLTKPVDVSLMISAWEWSKYLGDKLVKVCISSYQRPNPQSIHIDAKVCGHYVNSILATMEAKERGYDEALLLDMNRHVAETPNSNFFFEKNGVLHTPPPGYILCGITRASVMNICHTMDIPVVERFFDVEELEDAEGAFICGTAAEIAGVESIDARLMRKPWRDTIGSLIQEAYQCQVLDRSFAHVII